MACSLLVPTAELEVTTLLSQIHFICASSSKVATPQTAQTTKFRYVRSATTFFCNNNNNHEQEMVDDLILTRSTFGCGTDALMETNPHQNEASDRSFQEVTFDELVRRIAAMTLGESDEMQQEYNHAMRKEIPDDFEMLTLMEVTVI